MSMDIVASVLLWIGLGLFGIILLFLVGDIVGSFLDDDDGEEEES